MSIEYCQICDEPTGNAGRYEDSNVCEKCGQIICDNCISEYCSNDYIMCSECGNKLIAEAYENKKDEVKL